MDVWKLTISETNTMEEAVSLKATKEKISELEDRKYPE